MNWSSEARHGMAWHGIAWDLERVLDLISSSTLIPLGLACESMRACMAMELVRLGWD